MERKGICKNVGVCSKANKVQIITDDDAEFVCPECGEELEPYKEEVISPKKKNKLPVIVGSIVVIIAIILGSIIVFFNRSSKESIKNMDSSVDSLSHVAKSRDTLTITNTETRVDTVKIEKTIEKETTPISQKTITTTTTTSKATGNASGSLNLSYGKYTGSTKNGYPHGQGRLTYSTSRQINKNDTKGRTANAGDYVIGEFFNGFVVYGKHYDAAGNLLESLTFGVGSEDSYDAK